MWPFVPRERRQVYEGGGDSGSSGGGGHDAGGDGGFQGGVDPGGFQGGDVGGGGYQGDTGGGIGHGGTATPDSGEGTPAGGSAPDGGGAPAGGGDAPAGSGGAPAGGGGGDIGAIGGGLGLGEGAPGVGSGSQLGDAGLGGGGDADAGPDIGGAAPADGGFSAGGALSAAAAAGDPYGEATVSTGSMLDTSGYTPGFGSIVDQFGALNDPFATAPTPTSDDEDQRGPMDDFGNPIAPGALREGDQLAAALAPRDTVINPGALTFGTSPVPDPTGLRGTLPAEMPTAAPAPATPAPEINPFGGQLQLSPGAIAPDTAMSPAGPPATGTAGGQPSPDSTGAPSGAPNATPGAQPDISAGTADPLAGLPALPYTDAERAASQPSTELFSPEPNIGTAIMQAIFGLGGATIGGPVSAFLNQSVPGVLGGIGVPGVSTAAGLLGNAQTIAGATGATQSMAGSPMERAQPNIISMLWDELNGRPSRSRGISPIGGALRPSIASWLLSRDNRTPVGENPPPDPRTYDRGQLISARQPPGGVAQLLSPREQREAKMVPQDFDLTGGNQAGDNRVMDAMLTALGLEPTTQDTVTTGPTAGQLPSDFQGYFAGGNSDLNPQIIGQRTAFDPRRFLA